MSPASSIHVLGVNLAAAPAADRDRLRPGPEDLEALLRRLAQEQPHLEVVVLRARNHIEAYLAAPAASRAVLTWLRHLCRVCPSLLLARARSLHYRLSGAAAAQHLFRLTCGHYAPAHAADAVRDGVKAALVQAAACGTLGETLDGLFVQALHAGRRADGGDARRPATQALAAWERAGQPDFSLLDAPGVPGGTARRTT